VVIEALARGYYDWPRGINNEDLAAELEISRATLHEHLRRAEKKLLTMGLTDELVRPALGTPESTVADPTDSGHG
jgi:predicted DNA binding protein